MSNAFDFAKHRLRWFECISGLYNMICGGLPIHQVITDTLLGKPGSNLLSFGRIGVHVTQNRTNEHLSIAGLL